MKYRMLEAIQTRDTGQRVAIPTPLTISDWTMEYQRDSMPRKSEYIHRCQFGCKTVVSDSRTGDRDPVAESRDAATRIMAEVFYGDVRNDLLNLLEKAYRIGAEDIVQDITQMLRRTEPL